MKLIDDVKASLYQSTGITIGISLVVVALVIVLKFVFNLLGDMFTSILSVIENAGTTEILIAVGGVFLLVFISSLYAYVSQVYFRENKYYEMMNKYSDEADKLKEKLRELETEVAANEILSRRRK